MTDHAPEREKYRLLSPWEKGIYLHIEFMKPNFSTLNKEKHLPYLSEIFKEMFYKL